MAYVAPSTRALNDLISAAIWNQDVVANVIAVNAGPSADFTLKATQKLYLDGGSDTYIHESAANILQLVTGGAVGLTVDANSHVYLAPTKRLYLDSGSNTFVMEGSADRIDFCAGGSAAFYIHATDVVLPATNKLYLDGGSNTYVHESSSDVISFVANTVELFTLRGATPDAYLRVLTYFDNALVGTGATGGAKGNGTINAVAVYDDNVVLTDWVFDLAYDGRTTKAVPPGGRLYGLDETLALTRAERRLPWMPGLGEFEDERSLGGMITRLWFGQEQQQLHLAELDARLRALEARA